MRKETVMFQLRRAGTYSGKLLNKKAGSVK